MGSRPSVARDFFETIRAATDPAAFVAAMVGSTPPTFESDSLDFKGNPRSDDDKKRTWYEALSGFANSGGGVLVWGVDARKDPATDIDAANGLSLIPNPQGFKSRLIELQRGATDPPLGGVEIEAYDAPGETAKGFVVCFIPEGAFKPYRAEVTKAQNFYIRAGDQFRIPSPALLRVLFYPHVQARFRVMADVSYEAPRQAPEAQATFRADLRVGNSGTGSARDLTVLVMRKGSHPINAFPGDKYWSGRSNGYGQVLFESPRTVHPGLILPPFSIIWPAPLVLAMPGPRYIPQCPDIRFRVSLYAEHHAPQRADFAFDSDEIILGSGRQSKTCMAEPADEF